jgi:polysaccharide biosynthesis/export protein
MLSTEMKGRDIFRQSCPFGNIHEQEKRMTMKYSWGSFCGHVPVASFCRALMLMLLPAFVFLSSGCSHNAHTVQEDEAPDLAGPVMSDEYLLKPCDVVEIKFLKNPELNDTVTIRPDGRISLQMIDEVVAAGLTPAQLDDLLTRKYALLLSHTMITVVVRTFTNERVYVGGEVNLPQVITFTGRLNALQAVFMAGGFKPDARITRVIIVSKGPDNKPVVREVNLKKALAGEMDFEDYRLKPFDVVYVPQTRMAGIDQFMSHLYRFIPPQIGFGFTYEVHDASKEPD